MEKKYYILISILIGWASYFMFPIEDPALTYFLGIFVGVIGLFYIPNEKYTHNVWIQLVLWALLLVIFPEYLIAGLAVGVGTHLGLDRLKKIVEGAQLSFYTQWIFVMFLILVNSTVVTGITFSKFMNY